MTLHQFVENPRRSRRVPARCRVEVLHGTGSWRSTTQDIGPGGCQIVSPGPIKAGARVALTVTAAEVPETLRVAGRVVWASVPLTRAGVCFSAGPRVASWFDQLLRASPHLAAEPRGVPDRLAADATLYLGQPPPEAEAVDLGPAELLVLGLVADGATAGQIRTRLGRRWVEARGPLFGLLARKWVVVERLESVAQSRWRAILTDAEVMAAAAALGAGPLRRPETPRPDRTAPRPVPAQQSLERALACLRAGAGRTHRDGRPPPLVPSPGRMRMAPLLLALALGCAPRPGAPAPAAAPGASTAVVGADGGASALDGGARLLPLLAAEAFLPGGEVVPLSRDMPTPVAPGSGFRVLVGAELSDGRLAVLDSADAAVPSAGTVEIGVSSRFTLTPTEPLRPGSSYLLRLDGAASRDVHGSRGETFAPLMLQIRTIGDPPPPARHGRARRLRSRR